MANSSTQDITIWNEGGSISTSVTANNELSVASRIWDGTNYVTVTGNKLDVNASWSNSNKVIIWDGVDSADVVSANVIPLTSEKALVTKAVRVENEWVEGYVNNQYENVTLLNSGSLIRTTFYPQQLQENLLDSGVISASTTASINAMQIFRASMDNVNQISLYLGINSTATTLDTFDAIGANWVSSDATNTTVSQESTIKVEGTGSMKIVVKRGASSNNDTVTKTVVSTNMTTVGSFSFWMRSNQNTNRWKFAIGDGTNFFQSLPFTSTPNNTWKLITLSLGDFTEAGAGTTNIAAITKLRFQLTTAGDGASSYFDILQSQVASSITCTVQLYNFGATANPTNISQGTLLTLDDGTTGVSELLNSSANQNYEFSLQRGVYVSANALTIGNYYGIYMTLTSVNVYGTSTQKYTSGKLYTVNTGTGAFTDTTQSTGFQVYSNPVECYLIDVSATADATFGDATISLFQINASPNDNKIKQTLINDISMLHTPTFSIDFNKPVEILRSEGLLIELTTDSTSLFSITDFNFGFLVQSVTRYG